SGLPAPPIASPDSWAWTSSTMSEPPVPPVATLLADQRRRWARGQRVAAEDYVRRYAALADDGDGPLDLIYQEVHLRGRLGQHPLRDESPRRFPRLADAIGAQFDVHQAIVAGAEEALPAAPGYEVLAEVGRGGTGRVYRARDNKRGGLAAIKVLRAEHLG